MYILLSIVLWLFVAKFFIWFGEIIFKEKKDRNL
tara:strand:+ start:116 stop:217 length:102 start_codon:yes stop_codon:yes gene_type:complete